MNHVKDKTTLEVGQKLRVLRDTRGITLRELSRRSGLSANALSMIERGLTSPSVTTLGKLTAALEIPITALFREEKKRNALVASKAAERHFVPFGSGSWESLGGDQFSGRMEAFILTLDRGANSGEDGTLHTGQELVFCLSGEVDCFVNHVTYHLEKGDSLMFAGGQLHRWRNASAQSARVLILVAGYEETEDQGEVHFAVLGRRAITED